MPPSSPRSKPVQHLRVSDVRGLARLAADATTGVARITEGVHQSVLGTLGLPGGAAPGQTRGLTGLVYKSVRGVTQLVAGGIDMVLARLAPWLDAPGNAPAASSAEREAVLAALNGVLGDQLAEGQNPLATAMGLRYEGQPLTPEAMASIPASAGTKVLLLVHGLCMNDLQWSREGHDHGAHLAAALGYTPVYLRYNTGLHTSANGRMLADQLEHLVAQWPHPLQELTLLTHSMGGLVARSACHYASQAGHRWPQHLKNLVFLGTPHHGAPLERAGNWVDVLLASTPYSRPFAKLARMRSAGITDLRHGHVGDADWQGRDRFRHGPDPRQPVPLPPGVACYSVAATLAAKRSPLAERLVGDGLVPLRSALGQHDQRQHQLAFTPERQCVVYRTGHMELLSQPAVAQQLERWLGLTPTVAHFV
ncbi:MAG TPA: alpha/beta hydrolase [Burkholderiaceae bacterium]|nr:alpha/beta hydrolase [Burkholderiaceae bacterium]